MSMNMNRIADEKYRKVVTNVAPKFIKWQEVEVNLLTEGCLIDEYASVEYASIVSKLRITGGSVSFTEQEFIKFCRTYVYARICWVNNKTVIHPNTIGILVPTFLSLILQNIGRASNFSLGLDLVPAMPEFDPMEISEVRKISAELKIIPGYEGAVALPKDKAGCFEFMSMQLIDDQIVSHSPDAHPVYALMASIVGPSLIRSVLDPMVYYGDSNLYRGLLWELTSV